jgi:hypothetical protein
LASPEISIGATDVCGYTPASARRGEEYFVSGWRVDAKSLLCALRSRDLLTPLMLKASRAYALGIIMSVFLALPDPAKFRALPRRPSARNAGCWVWKTGHAVSPIYYISFALPPDDSQFERFGDSYCIEDTEGAEIIP